MQELELDKGGSLARPHRRAASDRLGISERSAAERRRAGLPARAARRGGGQPCNGRAAGGPARQEIRKTYPLVFVNGTPEAASCTRRPGPRTRGIYVLFSLYQFCLSGKNWQGVAARLRAAHAQRQPPVAAKWYRITATPSPRRPASGRVPPRWLSLLAAPGPPAAPAAPSEPRAGLTIDNDVVNFRR